MTNLPCAEIKLLMLEDITTDAELNAHVLRKDGIAFSYTHVENKADFLHELDHNPPDVILADYSLPEFDGICALAIAKEKCPDIPFIFVSGAIGEEVAVEALKNGATDYVIKDRLSRLPMAVRRALDEVKKKADLKQAEAALKNYGEHLEFLVHERTENLVKANYRLEQEITEHQKALLALRESEQRFRTLAEAMPQIVWAADPAGDLNYFNQRAYDYGGTLPGNIKEWNWSAIIHPDDRKASAVAWSAARQSGEVYTVEQRIRRRNGEYRWHLTRAVPVRDDNGTIMRWIGTSTDIHDNKLSEKKYATILENTQNGFYLLDREGKLLEVNRAYSDMSGYNREELLGMYIHQLEAVHSPAEVRKQISYVEEHGRHQFESRHRRQDGSLFDVDVSTTYIDIADGYVVAFIRDITERRKIEHMKDEFVGMVSHEIKTPLTVVIGALSTAMTPGIPEAEARDLLNDALTYAGILNDIIDNLLELSRSQSNRLVLQREPTDVARIVGNVINNLHRKSSSHLLINDIPAGLPHVFVDPPRLERILVNLVDNAIKYSPAGGKVRIFASQELDRLVIGVSDQGIGIPRKDSARLFQKFQRIARIESSIQGIGLGLNVCRILVEAHGGQIWVDSEKGKGSTFSFSIPAGSI